MSYNLLFAYVKGVLTDNGRPMTEAEIVAELPDKDPDSIISVIAWAENNGSLTLDGGRFELTERGRR